MHFKIAMWCMYTEKISPASRFNNVFFFFFFFNRQTDNGPEQKDFTSATVSQRPCNILGLPNTAHLMQYMSWMCTQETLNWGGPTGKQCQRRHRGDGCWRTLLAAHVVGIRGLSPGFSVLCLFHVKIFNLFTYSETWHVLIYARQ